MAAGWAPNTVFRGAYDISTYMEGNGVNNMAVVNPPNVELHDEVNNSGAGLAYPVTTLDQGYTPFSAACTPAQLMAFAPACFASGQAHATESEPAAGGRSAVEPGDAAPVQGQHDCVIGHTWATRTTTCRTSISTTRR